MLSNLDVWAEKSRVYRELVIKVDTKNSEDPSNSMEKDNKGNLNRR